MPHNDAPLTFREPVVAWPPPDTEPVPAVELAVMTRLLRLPTTSKAKARTIARLQLDRLSPLPASDILFDLVQVEHPGKDGLFALGVIRKTDLNSPNFRAQRVVAADRTVEGHPIVFRFRNPSAVSDREQRLLRHAPTACLLAVSVMAVAVSGAQRSERWKDQRLPEIAAAQRDATRAARDGVEQDSARETWMALERGDAATRALCVLAVFEQADGPPIVATSLTGTSERLTLTLSSAAAGDWLTGAGAVIDTSADGGVTSAVFEGGPCA